MHHFEVTKIIDQTLDFTFDYVADPENNHKWQSTYVSSEQISGNGMEIGAEYRYVNKFLGMNIESKGVITEYKLNSELAFKFKSTAVSGTSRMLFEEIDSKTKITAIGDVDLGFIKLGKNMAVQKAKKQMEADLNCLRTILEEIYEEED